MSENVRNVSEFMSYMLKCCINVSEHHLFVLDVVVDDVVDGLVDVVVDDVVDVVFDDVFDVVVDVVFDAFHENHT